MSTSQIGNLNEIHFYIRKFSLAVVQSELLDDVWDIIVWFLCENSPFCDPHKWGGNAVKYMNYWATCPLVQKLNLLHITKNSFEIKAIGFSQTACICKQSFVQRKNGTLLMDFGFSTLGFAFSPEFNTNYIKQCQLFANDLLISDYEFIPEYNINIEDENGDNLVVWICPGLPFVPSLRSTNTTIALVLKPKFVDRPPKYANCIYVKQDEKFLEDDYLLETTHGVLRIANGKLNYI